LRTRLSTSSRSLFADLSLVGICVVWGTSFAIVKSVVGDINPATFIAVRFGIASIILGLIASPRLKRLDRRTWTAGLLLAVPLIAGFLTQTYGLKATTASKAGFITGMHVVFTPLLEYTIGRRKVLPYQTAGVAVALVGLGLLTLEGFGRPSAGDLLVLACAFAFGLHIVMLGHYSPRHDGFLLSFTQMVWSAVLAAVISGRDMAQALSFGPEVVWSVTYLGATGTALAYLVQTIAQKYTPPTRAALIMQSEPVFAALFAWLLIGERMAAKQFAGAALILLGILVCQIGDIARPQEV